MGAVCWLNGSMTRWRPLSILGSCLAIVIVACANGATEDAPASGACDPGHPLVCARTCVDPQTDGADGGTSDGGIGMNGCECHKSAPSEKPDMSFGDKDCDGINGTIANAIFVSSRGSNSDPGTMQQPVATIMRGIALAQMAAPPKDV